MTYRPGQLLIAASTLKDPNFHRAVILLVRDDENGTFGLVLNRPLSTSVKDACATAMSLDCKIESPLHLGGPCEGVLTVLHADGELSDLKVMSNLFFTQDREKIEQLLRDDPSPAKYFAGYSGWTSGQLDAELETGSWIVTEATRELVFDASADAWKRIITRATIGKWVDIDRIPDDPSMN